MSEILIATIFLIIIDVIGFCNTVLSNEELAYYRYRFIPFIWLKFIKKKPTNRLNK